MALEAQLCPQCGATVQFADLQTEAVCSYCGTTVDKARAVAQASVARAVANVSELSAADQAKLKQLVLDGRRQDALNFIQRNTGLGDAHARAAVDGIAVDWQSSHLQPDLFSTSLRNVGLWVAVPILDVAVGLLLYVVLKANPTGRGAAPALTGMGAVFMLIVTIVWAGATLYALAEIKNSLNVWTGKAAPGVLRKVAVLKPAGAGAASPLITRLAIELPAQTLERALELPAAVVQQLAPGAKIEVITNGPSFVYIRTPIKVVG